MDPSSSVSFDRAAGYYDRTRAVDPAVAAAQTAMLLQQLATAPGPTLELGVGTGRIAVPLAEAGARVVGVDLSAPMLEQLRAKDPDGRVPVVRGDAEVLPFRDHAFGAAIACHVLHLVSDWVAVVGEVRRVLRPGGALLVTRGAARDGLMVDLTRRIRAQAGSPARRVGLDQLDDLDALVEADGGLVEHLPPIERSDAPDGVGEVRTVAAYLDALKAGIYSWTWDMPPDRVAAAVEDARQWLTAEHGDPEQMLVPYPPIRWHRYVFA